MQETFIHIKSLRVQCGHKVVLDILDARFQAGELWLVRGKSGSGKSTLAQILGSQSENKRSEIEVSYALNSSWNHEINLVENWYEFQNLEGDRNFFYQQRYQNYTKKDTKTVAEELEFLAIERQIPKDEIEMLLDVFQLRSQWQNQVLQLSSGEHKKLQLLKALLKKSQFLILDQPFLGLDVASRSRLMRILENLVNKGVGIIVFTNDEIFTSIPVYEVELVEGNLIPIHRSKQKSEINVVRKPLPTFLKVENLEKQKIVDLKNCTIRYVEKLVLNQVDWTIYSGEQWVLKGPNGSGKSTLLSLITADHPQSYANTIELFGNKRGSGESIWDIKEKIGLISPELQWYFDEELSVSDAIASGFFGSIGVLKKLSYVQNQQLNEILNYFNLQEVRNIKLKSLSRGQQRMVLIARTLVKRPLLLIFDEPCQGLDETQIQLIHNLVDDLIAAGQTLIYVGHFESQLPKNATHKLELQHGKVVSNKKLTRIQKI